jgi:nitrite reductase (NADH) large subunit
MKVLIIGNGLAGIMAGKTIRELEASAEIIIFSEEKYRYYPRPNLIDFLAGLLPLDKIFAFPPGWEERQKLIINLDKKVKRIAPDQKFIELDSGEKIGFERLVLATGAEPSLPAIPGIKKKGIFAIRKLDDVLALIDYLKSGPEIAVLGGGLLGLEIARALRFRGLEKITVVEYFDRLLPRQLDEAGAAILQFQMEKFGLKFLLGKETMEIIAEDSVSGLRFKDGGVLSAGAVVIASGIKPRVELASACGLKCSRGVIVDDYLQTSHPAIYAAGDVAEHRGKIYGLIPAAFDQARLLAQNLCGQMKRYEGTIPSNTLKVAGIYLSSMGMIQTENGNYEILVKSDPDKGIYKKLILKDGYCTGAIWLGTKKGVQEIGRLIQLHKNIGRIKKDILNEDFDFSRLDSV